MNKLHRLILLVGYVGMTMFLSSCTETKVTKNCVNAIQSNYAYINNYDIDVDTINDAKTREIFVSTLKIGLGKVDNCYIIPHVKLQEKTVRDLRLLKRNMKSLIVAFDGPPGEFTPGFIDLYKIRADEIKLINVEVLLKEQYEYRTIDQITDQ